MAAGNQHPKRTNYICFCFLVICWRTWSWGPEKFFHSIKSRKLKNLFLVAWLLRERARPEQVCVYISQSGSIDKIGKGVRSISSANVRKQPGLHYVDPYIELQILFLFFPWENCCLLLSNDEEINESWVGCGVCVRRTDTVSIFTVQA